MFEFKKKNDFGKRNFDSIKRNKHNQYVEKKFKKLEKCKYSLNFSELKTINIQSEQMQMEMEVGVVSRICQYTYSRKQYLHQKQEIYTTLISFLI